MPRYLTFHNEPGRKWEDLEKKYRVLVRETTAEWRRTFMEGDCAHRVCEWISPSEETLQVLFKRVGIGCDRIVEVTEILPGRFRKGVPEG